MAFDESEVEDNDEKSPISTSSGGSGDGKCFAQRFVIKCRPLADRCNRAESPPKCLFLVEASDKRP